MHPNGAFLPEKAVNASSAQEVAWIASDNFPDTRELSTTPRDNHYLDLIPGVAMT